MLFVSSSQCEGMLEAKGKDAFRFEEVMQLLSPYNGVNLETISKEIGGVIPNRNSVTVYSEEGEYTVGRIGEYFGAVSIVWKNNEYSIPLLRGATIGMSRSEFDRKFPLLIDQESTTEYVCTDNNVTFISTGDYLHTKITATINWIFVNDCLDGAELLLYAYRAE